MRDGICRIVRLLGDRSDGDPIAGGGGGVSCAGESCGESSELMSMTPLFFRLFQRCAPNLYSPTTRLAS